MSLPNESESTPNPPQPAESEGDTSANSGARDERALAKAFVANEPGADEEVFRRYQIPIQRFVWMMTRDTGLSEDIAQEVFIRAAQKRELLREPYNIGSWLFTIARNIAMRQFKKSKPSREELVEDGAALEALGARAHGQGKNAAQRELHMEKIKDVMREAMERLDPVAAEMVYLHYFERKTFQQIADELNTPLGTVCTKISRSLKTLRKTIKRSGYQTRDMIWTRLSSAGF